MIEGRVGPGGTRVYRARVYYRGRYIASRTFARKRDAQEWERRQVETLKTGAWADPKAGEKPVREWCEIWVRAQPARAAATERKINGVIAKQIAGAFGRRPLISVRPSEVQAWAADISRKQSPATARHSLGVLRRVFDYAVRDGAIHRNPAAGIKLPKVQGNDPRPLTHDELWRLAEHLTAPRDRLLVLVAGYCGLRWGELAALRWADVDLANDTLRVTRSYSEEAPRGELSPVKDHQARTVPIPAVVPEQLAGFGIGCNPDRLVFPSANSTPLRNRNFRRDVFDDAVEALDLEITPHNLRDTAASLAIQAGASVVAVARLLGHESAATTLNHYAGLFPSDLDDVAARLDDAVRQAIKQQQQRENWAAMSARRWLPAGEVLELLHDLPADPGLREDLSRLADEAFVGCTPDELRMHGNAAVNSIDDPEAPAHETASGHETPSGATEAPTKRRPERRRGK